MRQTRSRTKQASTSNTGSSTQTPTATQIGHLENLVDLLRKHELLIILGHKYDSRITISELRECCYDLIRSDFQTVQAKIASIQKGQAKQATAAEPTINYPRTTQIFPATTNTSFQQPQNQVAQQSNQQHNTQSQSSFVPITQTIHNNGNSNLSINNNSQTLGSMYQPNMVCQPTGNGTVPQIATHHTNGALPPYTAPAMQNGFPVHPEVKLKKLAFFDVLATLLKPSTLIPMGVQRMQEGTYYFNLTPQQATEIASNRDMRNSSKLEHNIQVQLRFCQLETSIEQDDYFPPSVVVKVNNKLCALPNPIPTNKPGVEPKRPPRPVNITANVKLSPAVVNHISVAWCTEYNRGFVVSAYLVKKVSSDELLNRMKTKGVKPSEFTRGLIKEKLNDEDCDIATTELRVSLMCPLGKMRMTTPCRASTCSHLQCFDGSLYLQMNERKPTWNCPVCDKAAVYKDLVIDGYFQEVLASSDLPCDTNEILLHKDGAWSTTSLNESTQNLDTPCKKTQVEVISDDIEVIEDTPERPKISIKLGPKLNSDPIKAAQPTPTPATNNDPVDLTLSDSDDDIPLIKTRAALQQNSIAAKAAAATEKTNDTSIISLDSPSPPSSPVGRKTASPSPAQDPLATPTGLGVSSTTTQLPSLSPLDTMQTFSNYGLGQISIDPSFFSTTHDLSKQILQPNYNTDNWNMNNHFPHDQNR